MYSVFSLPGVLVWRCDDVLMDCPYMSGRYFDLAHFNSKKIVSHTMLQKDQWNVLETSNS